jgi:hypothetical protein
VREGWRGGINRRDLHGDEIRAICQRRRWRIARTAIVVLVCPGLKRA